MCILYEQPDPLDKRKPSDDSIEITEDEQVSDDDTKQTIDDILKRISSYRKSKSFNGGKNNGRAQRTLRSDNRRRNHKRRSGGRKHSGKG